MEILLVTLGSIGLAWGLGWLLCNRSKDSRSWGTARLEFLSRLPDRLYGRDLKRAYLAATITELSPVAAAMVGIDRFDALDSKMGDVLSTQIRDILDQGIADQELFTIGGTHEIKTAEFELHLEISHKEARLHLCSDPYPLRNGVVH